MPKPFNTPFQVFSSPPLACDRAPFTDEQLKEAFVIFGGNPQSTQFIEGSSIPTAKLGTVMRSLGTNPSQAEVESMMKDFGDTIEFPDFCSLMNKAKSGVATEAELVEAFRVFDKDGNGFISTAETRNIMFNLGESLQEEELDEIVREIDPNGEGQVNYVDFVKIMLEQHI
jgi:calmodulin